MPTNPHPRRITDAEYQRRVKPEPDRLLLVALVILAAAAGYGGWYAIWGGR